MVISKVNKTYLSVIIVSLLFVFQQFASKAGNFVANNFNYNTIDEYGIFAKISVHHIVQMLLALVIILVLARKYKINFGFCVGNKKLGIKNVLYFTAVIFVFAFISYGIAYASNQMPQYEYPLNFKNIIGSLGFQLLLSGPSEEILFRALPISVLIFWVGSNKKIKIAKWDISLIIIISAVLFSVAHISWTVNPISISMDYFQLIFAFVLGVVFGVTYQKSGSLIYPMMMHSITNVIMVGLGYALAIIAG